MCCRGDNKSKYLILLLGLVVGCSATVTNPPGLSHMEFRLTDEEIRALDHEKKFIYLAIVDGWIKAGKPLSPDQISAANNCSDSTIENDGYIRWRICLDAGKSLKEGNRIAFIECEAETNVVRECGTATLIK